jgi:hypothetical protein
MSVFGDIHAERVLGSLAMFDRLIFKGLKGASSGSAP